MAIYYPGMPSPDYWKARATERIDMQFRKADAVNRELKKTYDKAQAALEEKLAAFYLRYETENGLSYAEAVKRLTDGERAAFRERIEAFALGMDELTPAELQVYSEMALRSRINRLEALVTEIRMECAELAAAQNQATTAHLSAVLKDSYVDTMTDIAKGMQLKASFSALPTAAVKEALTHPWSGEMFSERIWVNRDKLVRVLRQEITQGLIQGKGIRPMAKALQEEMGKSYRAAARIVYTETSYITNQATLKAYMESDVIEKYQYVAVLDKDTSSLCQRKHMRPYYVKDAKPGINWPPLHPNCRSTTVPYFGQANPQDYPYEFDPKSDIIILDSLPGYKDAVIPDDKLRVYALKKDANKAKAFQDALGYGPENADDLMAQIHKNLPGYKAKWKPASEYGQRFEVVMRMTGPTGKEANVLTAWMVKDGDTYPSLTSAYVTKKKVIE